MTLTVDDSAPTFINPPNILSLTDDEIDLWLEGIRHRRMQKLVIYTETVKEKERLHLAQLETKMIKKGEQFERQLQVVDRAYEKLEMIVNEIRGMRLQMLIDPM